MAANHKPCAYCGEVADLTNEHVFPECFRKTFGSITTAKTPTGEKAVSSALLIGDVSAACNHGPLSELDSYLCGLNDEYFRKLVRPGDRVRFRFESDLLLRMLLKVGFNVARARKWPLETWHGVPPYVLGRVSCPSSFRVFLQLMIPTPAEKTNLPVTPGTTEVPPWPMSVYLEDMSSFPGLAFGFWVSIWSYRFFVLREDSRSSSRIQQKAIAKWSKARKGVYEITRSGVATIYASSVDVLSDAQGSAIFREQLSLSRKLKSEMESRKAGHRDR